MSKSNSNDIDEMVDDLLIRASDDWVMLLEVDDLVKRNTANAGRELDGPQRVLLGMNVIRRAIESGFVRPGDVVEESPGFVPWDTSPNDAIERIEREWLEAGENLEMGDVCWLASTPDGDARADELRNRLESG